jgi:DNA-binding NtrC family response regulator
MVQSFIKRYSRKLGKQITSIQKETITRWRIEGKDGTAAILGVNPSTLRMRMHKLGIVRSETKESD